jgi:L-asparaginase/Glu-tRNA(Gln) amidotransferase subunit D
VDMKLLTLLFTTITLLALALNALADPPENATKHMVPYPVLCTPTMTEMIGALTKDYAVHISMTFEESPISGIVVVHNPDTSTAAVLHITADRTCLVFSGLQLRMFERPEGMAPPAVEVQQDFEES